jgi:hypothetical protein
MKGKLEPKALLQQIALIQRMERGKLCRMGAGGYYNHQTWEKGRNVVRYVARERLSDLQEAIAGYQQYLRLTQAYADEMIRRSRKRQPKQASSSAGRKRRKMPKPL